MPDLRHTVMKNTLALTWTTVLIGALDSCAIVYLCDYALETGSGPGVTTFVYYYPLLLMVNTIAWFLLKVFDHPLVRPMKYIVIVLLALFLPLAWIIGSV